MEFYTGKVEVNLHSSRERQEREVYPCREREGEVIFPAPTSENSPDCILILVDRSGLNADGSKQDYLLIVAVFGIKNSDIQEKQSSSSGWLSKWRPQISFMLLTQY